MSNTADLKESLVSLENSQGVELRGTLLRLTRFTVGFEVYNANGVLRLSEVLGQFRIILQDRSIYSGRAVIESLVNTGLTVVCEASLEEASWMDVHFDPTSGNGNLQHEFSAFIEEWQKLYKVANHYKVIVADMQNFFADLRLWLNQVELGVRASPSGDRLRLEQSVADELAGPTIELIDNFIERFEVAAEQLEHELRPSHRAYLRRQLHPLLLSSPFAYRAYNKPLGYPGDYELINMMMRSPCEGSTLFAKVLNIWLLGQAPVRAHRNRIAHLKKVLIQEVARAAAGGRRNAKIFNLGCGPAWEIQEFIAESELTGRVQFSLLDFNEETLAHTRQVLNDAMNRGRRNAAVQLMKKSVAHLLKEAGRPHSSLLLPEWDFVYCAGLFDYLPDYVCEKLMAALYRMVAPGGLLLATNVNEAMNWSRPFRHSMEYILDWHLIYRNGVQMQALARQVAPQDACKVYSEETGVNVFIEVRKPHDA